MAISVLVILVLSIAYIVPSQGCGKSKSCFKWPLNCKTPSDCNIFVTYSFSSSDNTLDVEISGHVSGWLAFGLNSRPRFMGGTNGEICYLYEGKVYLKGFVNIGTDFDFAALDSRTVIEKNEYSNGTLSCRYKRSTIGSYMKSLNDKWYLISSWGDIRNKGGRAKPREHDIGSYFWSKDIVDLKRSSDVQCTTFGWHMISLHGAFMITAWVGFAAAAVFYARYMKVVWTDKSCAGENIWFQLHRGFMIVAVILTAVGFIIILVEAKGYINDEFLLHVVIGFCVVISSVIQAFIGIFKPKPSSDWRKTFNWIHWAVGTITLMLSGLSIIFGHFYMNVSAAAIYTYIAIIVLSFVGLELRRCIKFKRIITEDLSQEQQHMEEELEYPAASIAKEQTIRKIVAYIVLGSGFGFAIIMIGIIASQGHSLSKAGT